MLARRQGKLIGGIPSPLTGEGKGEGAPITPSDSHFEPPILKIMQPGQRKRIFTEEQNENRQLNYANLGAIRGFLASAIYLAAIPAV
jgi:hypothetical protein